MMIQTHYDFDRHVVLDYHYETKGAATRLVCAQCERKLKRGDGIEQWGSLCPVRRWPKGRLVCSNCCM